MGDEHRQIDVLERRRFSLLQALEDAIAYRQARVAAPCPGCRGTAAGQRCDDHSCDLDLIVVYQQAANSTIAELAGSAQAAVGGPRRHEA